jgi:hypothetical protein
MKTFSTPLSSSSGTFGTPAKVSLESLHLYSIPVASDLPGFLEKKAATTSGKIQMCVKAIDIGLLLFIYEIKFLRLAHTNTHKEVEIAITMGINACKSHDKLPVQEGMDLGERLEFYSSCIITRN